METTTRRAAARPSWGKRIVLILGVLALLLVAGFFVVTSSGFIKAVILPKAGAALNAKVTAQDVSLSPFSQLHLTGLRVETTGSEPLLTAQEVRIRYGLIDILKGNIKVDEVTLTAPVLQIVQQPDGTSNLDPILNRPKSNEPDKPKSNEPTKLSVRNVSLKNGTVRQVVLEKGGGRKTTEISGLEITLDQLANGQSGKLNLNAGLSIEQKNGATNDVLRGTISGGYTIALTQDLLPQTLTGSTKLAIATAQGAFAELAGFNGALDADLTPKELKRVALVFSRNNERLGEIRASGPLDLEKKEGNIRVEVLSLDKNALALVTAGKGMDFRETRINSTNQVVISKNGTFLAANGSLNGAKISIAQGETVTPETDLNLEYEATVNTAEKSAVLQKLNLTGSAGGKQFLRTDLDRQMNLSWGETVKGYKDAALHLVLTNFNLADWRAVVGTNISAGLVNATVSLTAQQDGKKLVTDIAARVTGLTGTFASNRLEKIDVTLSSVGTVSDLNVVDLSKYAFTLAQAGENFLQGEGAARYDLKKNETTAQLTARGELPRLLTFAALTNVTARAGRIEVSATYSEAAAKRKALGTLAVKNFTGSSEPYHFTNYQAAFDYNIAMDEKELGISRLSATFSEGFNPGGTVDLKGKYDLQQKSGQFSFNTVDLNENAFRPILAPSLGENQLVSISLNSTGEAALNPAGENQLKANLRVTNWVVTNPAGTLPKTPLGAEMSLDAGMRETKLDLRDFGLKLSPTPRAKNELRVQGKLDLGKTNPAPSTLAIRAESLDLTPFYDIFAGGTNAAAKPAQPAPSGTPNGGPVAAPQEPAPIQLPFQQLVADLKIDQLYLREVAISNWTGQLSIKTNTIVLQPFKFTLNGGAMSVTANVDTGTPGYRYDVAFQAASVPLLPLANSFSSGNSNKIEGNLIADARVTGAGVTGPSLRKNLGGQIAVNFTNLNYELVGPKLRRIAVPISIALRVPELTETPVNWMALQANIGNGTVNLQKLGVQSEAFYAESAGAIVLADVITNSPLNLPLELSLRRSLAEKTHLLSANTPTNAKYAALPQFVTVKGTIGAPEADINKLAIAGMLARGAAGFGLGNDKTEQALGAVGSLLTGQRAANGAGATNNANTNTSAAGNLFQAVGGLLGGNAQTNSAPQGTNAPGTNQPAKLNPFDLLRALPQGQKK